MIKLESGREPHRTLSGRVLIAFVLMCTISFPSRGQDGSILVRPSLFVTSPEVSGPFDVGLRFEIEPEWYLYWVNPGDAGLPLEVNWELPEGWTAGPLRFPTPEKIVKGGVTAFGYHNELVVLCQITPRQGPRSHPSLGADLDWLVCRESCLPGRAQLTLDLEPGRLKGAVVEQGRLKEYTGRFPQAIASRAVSVGSLEVESTGATRLVTIRITGSDAAKIVDFYPEPIEGFTADLSGIQVLGDRICLRLTPENESSFLQSLKGLVIIEGRGYQLEASVASE